MPAVEGLSGKRWPAHPHRQEDELLSSWVVRTAYANRLKLQSFTTLTFGKGARLWNRDIDGSASDDILTRLSEQTGSSIEELRGGMLDGFEGVLFYRHNPNGNTKWILPLGVYHQTRTGFGMQFCPRCLFFDERPYYRRRWRLALYTTCDVHGTMLHDRCPACSAPVIYFRNDLGRRSGYRLGDLTSCWKCDFDLRRAAARAMPPPDWKSHVTLQSLVMFPDLAWKWQGDQSTCFPPLYFETLHHLVRLLASAAGHRMLSIAERETGWVSRLEYRASRFVFEGKPVQERHQLLVAVLWLLDEWPDRFLRIAREAGLTTSQAIRDETLPFWFESRVREGLVSRDARRTVEEAEHAAAYLTKSGAPISMATVGRLIGNRSVAAAKRFAKKRPVMSDTEFQHTLSLFDEEISALPPRSKRRLLCQRDKVIFRLIRMTGWTVTRVIGLTVRDAVQLATTPREDRDFPGAVCGLMMTYLRDVRPRLACEDSGDALFIGWRQGAVTANAFRETMRRRSLQWGLPLSAAFPPRTYGRAQSVDGAVGS